MRVYVESNFVLEIALEQEQHRACEDLVRLAEDAAIELVLPSFALLEPYHTHRLVDLAPAKAAHFRHRPHHDVQRVVRLELRPCRMLLACAWTDRLAPGAVPLATAPEQLLLDMLPAR